MRKWITIVLVVCMLLCSCGSIQEESSIVIEEKDRDTVLKVYMCGDEMVTSDEDFWQTQYSIGEAIYHSYVWGEDAHMYKSGIDAFDKISPLEIEVIYFNSTEELLFQAAQDTERGNGPDVIIGSYTQGYYDLYSYMIQGLFEDLNPFFEKDAIYTDGNYINRLLKAGEYDGHQYIFPLTFDMNILMTSKEVMQEQNLWLSREYTVDEIQQVFEARWRELAQKQNKTEVPLIQFTRMDLDLTAELFRAGGGVSFLDPEAKRVQLDREYFEQLLSAYEAYLYQDFGMNREELTQFASVTYGDLVESDETIDGKMGMACNGKSILEFFNMIHDRVGCFADGGNCGYLLHSFAAQVNYYESRYRDAGEEFVCIGIPTRQNPEGYAAQITSFGGVVKDARHPEEGYQLLKTLADTERFLHLDLSVNRQRTEDILQKMATTEFEFYPSDGDFCPDRVPEGEDRRGDCYIIQPMSQETVEYLREMIDKIEVATLPNQTVNEIVYSAMEDYIYRGVETVDEAYQNAVKQLEEYVENKY